MNKTIRGGAREIIYKVFMRCLAEFQAGRILSELEQVYKRAADMTGKSNNKTDGKFGTPAKHRKGRPRYEFDDFDKCAVRQIVQFFLYCEKSSHIKKVIESFEGRHWL